MRLRGLAGGRGLVGVLVDELIEREGAGLHDLNRAGDGGCVAPEQARHLGSALQVALGVGVEPQARLVDRRLLAHAGEHVLQRAAVGRVIEHVAGGNERRRAAIRERGKGGDARAVVAAIGVACREIERAVAKRRFHAPKRRLRTLRCSLSPCFLLGRG